MNALNAGLANISSGTLNTVVLVTTEAGGPPAGQPIITRADPVSVYVASPSGSSPVSSQPVSAKIEVPPIPDVTAMASVSVFIESPPGNSSVSSQPVSAKIDLPATVNATAAAAVSAAIDIPASRSITVCDAVAVRIMSATEKALTIVKNGAGSGTVVSTPAGITCGANCTQAFTTNTVVSLTATPVTNFLFTGWSGGGCSGTGACTVTMSSDLVVTAQFDNPLTVTTGSLPWGTVGTAYSQTLTVTGGLTPYNWSITSGSLPAGLTLNSSTGVISGTPTTTGTSNFTVKAVDARYISTTQALSIVINAALPDLIMTAVSGPTTGKKGKTITINYTVKNQGAGNAGQFSIGFYLSTDAAITTGDTLLKTVTITSLNSNSQSASSTTVTIPAGKVGTYYIGAIADVNGNISEANETNNSMAGNQIVIQ